MQKDYSQINYKKYLSYFFWQKEDQFERIVFKKSVIVQKSEKADLLGSNKNAVCCDWCQEGVVLCRNLSDGISKVLYCVGIVSDGVRKVSEGVRKVSDHVRKVSDGDRTGVNKIFS